MQWRRVRLFLIWVLAAPVIILAGPGGRRGANSIARSDSGGALCERHPLRAVPGSGKGGETCGRAGRRVESDSCGAGVSGSRGEVGEVEQACPNAAQIRRYALYGRACGRSGPMRLVQSLRLWAAT